MSAQITSLASALLAALVLAGCAAPPAPDPFEGAAGVLGSMAQARPAAAQPGPVEWPAKAAQSAQFAQVPGGRQAGHEAADARAALRAAEDAYTRGDWLGAAGQFKRLTDVYPNNGQLWFGFGASSALSGNLQEAAAGFERALRIDAHDARAAYNLGLVRLSQADMALNQAIAGMDSAPAEVRGEIARLRTDLAPLFGRAAQPGLPGAAPPAPMARTQDPARSAGRGAPDSASLARPLPQVQP